MEFASFTHPFERAALVPRVKASGARTILKLTSDELAQIYQAVGRDLTWAELGIFSAMWSEHCSYKSSRVHLGRLPSEGPHVVHGPGENAGIVEFDGDLCVAFKMESHNHPSFLEPYQGAATGVGGILRDVFCMGARPIALANCLRFGARDHPKTEWLVDGVVRGIGDYGNCVGVPTVAGNTDFADGYDGNILVNAMAVGLVQKKDIFTGHASGVGNLIVYVGSATGRDGVNGATMASDTFGHNPAGESRSAVQVGDPFCEKRLLEATLESLSERLVIGLQDMGAAGLTSSLVEMAERAGSGIQVDLDQVPKRCAGLSAYELMLSESQERMVMVCTSDQWPKLSKVLDKWDLESAIIGRVTDRERFEAVYQGRLEIDLPLGPLTCDVPRLSRPMSSERSSVPSELSSPVADGASHLSARAAEHAIDARPIYEQYDRHVQARTVLDSSHGGAAVLEIREGSIRRGLSISTAGCQRYCEVSPFAGAALTVARAARSLHSVGSTLLGVTDCLNFGSPEDPAVMKSFSLAIDGIAEACRQLGVPVVSGNVSLYNETAGSSIPPTPMIGMIGKVQDVSFCRPAVLQPRASTVWLIEALNSRCIGWGGIGVPSVSSGSDLPEIDWQAEKEGAELVRLLLASEAVVAIRDVGSYGVIGTCLKMALASDCGFELEGLGSSEQAWADRTAAYVVQSEPAKDSTVRDFLGQCHHVRGRPIGEVRLDGSFVVDGEKQEGAPLQELFHRFP